MLLAERAREAMSAEAFAYVAGGAGTGATMRANRAAFDRWRIVPRMLRDVSKRDASVELLGRTLPAPFLVAPIGVLEMAAAEDRHRAGRPGTALRARFGSLSGRVVPLR
jgi:lactate 2-monooxygenase